MKYDIDIIEDDILALGHNLLQTLLRDCTTGKNIFWATEDYYMPNLLRFDIINADQSSRTGQHLLLFIPWLLQ